VPRGTPTRHCTTVGGQATVRLVAMLDGRVVIVTGGGRGLGRAHCLELARHGASVVVNDLGVSLAGERSDGDDGVAGDLAAQVAREIEQGGGRAVSDTSSVADWEAMRALVDRTVGELGALDVVVNNAGIIRDGMLTSLAEADIDAVLAVHLKGTIALTKHACDHWRSVAKAGGAVTGRIVNTTSGAGLFGNVGQVSYGTAKAAIASFTGIVAMEMQRYGVTANAISPLAATRMTTEYLGRAAPETGDGWDAHDPANASPVVAWLASAESGWLSGAVLRIIGNTVQRVRGWEVDERAAAVARSGERFEADELDLAMRKLFGILPRGLGGT
jgi:NAD(P)-dependent dehydrogenase (short-subunit alcohol dehydrogenase family)